MSELGPRLPDPRMIPPWQATPPPAAGFPRHRPAADADPRTGTGDQVTDDPLVRPFMLTGGRTRPLRTDLRLETLVLAEPAALHAPLAFESRTIVEVCQAPRSVAEVAVRLATPLGVARVLISDLITDGYLRVPPQQDIAIDLLERIRDRVRAL